MPEPLNPEQRADGERVHFAYFPLGRIYSCNCGVGLDHGAYMPTPEDAAARAAVTVLDDEVTRLTAKRDEAIRSRDGWAARMMEFATAQQEIERLTAEVAELQAVIADAVAIYDNPDCDWDQAGHQMAEALSAVPREALDTMLREARAGALRDAAEEYGSGQLTGVFLGRDDYTRAWLVARASREGADRA